MTMTHLSAAGFSLDCEDPPTLAAFYVRLLGGRVLWTDDAGAGMRTASGLTLVAQKVEGYVPPMWPGSAIVHLDLDAGDDLDGAVTYARDCGATLVAPQPDTRWTVLLDPAGHPFCITTMTWTGS